MNRESYKIQDDKEEIQWQACNKIKELEKRGNETKALGLNTSMKAD